MEYFNYFITGLYLRKDRRLMVTLKDKSNGFRTSMSFPKLLMELYLGKQLNDLTVDHIDGNPLNNNLSNLQVLDRNTHTKLDAIINEDIEVSCIICSKCFKISGSKLHWRNRKDREFKGYFCSKKCVGLYGRMVQKTKIKLPINEDKKDSIKYKLKLSAQREISDVELLKFGEILDKFKDRLMMIIPSQACNYLFTDKLLEGVETKQGASKS